MPQSDPYDRPLELNLFTVGDARQVTTWSGLPNGLLRGLEAAGVTVNTVNIAPAAGLVKAYGFLNAYVRRFLHTQLEPQFLLSLPNRARTQGLVWLACRRHAGAGLNVFLSFEFSSRRTSRNPFALYCDTTFGEHLLKGPRRPLRSFERRRLRTQQANIRDAAVVICTNRHSIDYVRRTTGGDNVVGDPLYGINLTGCPVDLQCLPEAKRSSLDVLFVASDFKSRGGDILIEAVRNVNLGRRQPITLHVVGYDAPPDGTPTEHVIWHGHLRKDVPDEARRYWNLWSAARMLVMPLRTGPLPGVIAEAQHLYTPVVAADVWDMSQLIEHGETGILVNGAGSDGYISAIQSLLDDDVLWMKLALQGRTRAQEYDWSNVGDRFARELRRACSRTG